MPDFSAPDTVTISQIEYQKGELSVNLKCFQNQETVQTDHQYAVTVGHSFINLLPALDWTQVRISKDLVRNIQENPKSDLATPSKYRISELKRSWANFRSIG